MIKILIVDDEKLVRKGILAKLKSQGYEYAWIGEAANGEEALEAIGAESPQIVITDIKMPFMDGITLIRHARETHPEIKFIIISGYAEFEYAQQALNMGVSGYILKPISDDMFAKAMTKVVASVEQESEVRGVLDRLDASSGSHAALLFERRVNQVFSSPDASAKDGPERPNSLNIGEPYSLVLIHIDSTTYNHTEYKYNDLDRIKESIRELLVNASPYSITVMDNYKDVTQLMVLLGNTDRARLQAISDHFTADAYSRIRMHMKIYVTIAVSDIGDGITAELFRQAMAAYDQRLTTGGNQIYKYRNLELRGKINYPDHKLKLLKNCLELYDFKNALIILKDIFSEVNGKNAPGVHVRFLYSEIVILLLKTCSQLNIDIEKSLDADMVSGQIIDTFDSTDDIVNYLYTTIIDVMKADAIAAIDCKDMINRVKNYIAQNFTEEIMVKDLAHKFAFNPNYLSTIFKKETGRPVSKYLEEIRIDRACQLLLHTRNSISDIAQSVGYADAQYFYRVFKKVVGVTPMDYRNKGKPTAT